jgi:hypothetical protein
MGDLMNENAGHMDDETYQGLQTIRFHLKAKGQTAVDAFKKKDPLREPVSKILCDRMKEAYKGRQDRQEKKRQAAEEQRERVGAPVPVSKTASKKDLLSQTCATKSAHRQAVANASSASDSNQPAQKRPCASSSTVPPPAKIAKKQTSLSTFFKK